jgi:hypothetical protein
MIGGIVGKKLSAAHSFGRPFIGEAGSSESKMRPQQGSAAGRIVAARTGAILVGYNGLGAAVGPHPGVNGHLVGVSRVPAPKTKGSFAPADGPAEVNISFFLIPALCLAATTS